MHYTLCDLAADLAQNAAESGATSIEAEFRETSESFGFRIADNGKGMDEATLNRVRDPFFTDGLKHPGRKVGLGIPFLIQTATQSGGSWSLESTPGKGTIVKADFDLRNVDTPPIGDLPGLFRTILLFPGSAETRIVRDRQCGGRTETYELRKSTLSDALGDLEDATSLALLTKYLHSQEEESEE